MKKYLLILIIGFGICISCSKSDSDETGKSSSEKGYAPADIYNKILEFNGGSYYISEFKSNGACTVKMSATLAETITKEPIYTYLKESANVADFKLNYSESSHFLNNTTYYDVSYNLKLTFTSTTKGELSGTVNFIKTGGNSGSSIPITFKNKPFNLN